MSLPFSSTSFNFQPEVYLFPEQYNDDFRLQLRKYLNNIASALNVKENGFYLEEETPTAGVFIPIATPKSSANVKFRPMFRKVVDFGALPNATTKSVPHGISTTENYSIIKLQGGATDAGVSTLNSALAIPMDGIPNNQRVSLTMDATDVIIQTSMDRTNYTRTFIVIEYIKEV